MLSDPSGIKKQKLGEWEFGGFLPLPISIYLTELKAVWAGSDVKRKKETEKSH